MQKKKSIECSSSPINYRGVTTGQRIEGSTSSTDLNVSSDSDIVFIGSDSAKATTFHDTDFLSKTISPLKNDLQETPPPANKPLFSHLKKYYSTPPSSEHKKDLYKVIQSPTFLANYEKVKEYDAKKYFPNQVVRKKKERKLLHGFDCNCCSMYYKALGLDSAERQSRIDQVSRHRYVTNIPSTPEHYWEVKMADRDEQLRRGQIAETNSPVGLRPRNQLYATKSLRRRLFNA